eukprot:scaffold919_cov153-Ochromonas_danica.AAC.16
MDVLMDKIEEVQDLLSYHSWRSEHFASSKGLGRAGLTAFLLGLALGLSLATLGLLLALQLLQGPWTAWIFHVLAVWSLYWLCLSLFHFLEFFSTALFQPAHLTADSDHVCPACSGSVLGQPQRRLHCRGSGQLDRVLARGVPPARLQDQLAGQSHWLSDGRGRSGAALRGHGAVRRELLSPDRAAPRGQPPPRHSRAVPVSELLYSTHSALVHSMLIFYSEGRFVRHPSYAGWFFWCIGTQVLLCNPLCTIGFVVVSWRFFKERITYEEATLLEFFGESYRQYSQRTVSGIPFIRSPLL